MERRNRNYEVCVLKGKAIELCFYHFPNLLISLIDWPLHPLCRHQKNLTLKYGAKDMVLDAFSNEDLLAILDHMRDDVCCVLLGTIAL